MSLLRLAAREMSRRQHCAPAACALLARCCDNGQMPGAQSCSGNAACLVPDMNPASGPDCVHPPTDGVAVLHCSHLEHTGYDSSSGADGSRMARRPTQRPKWLQGLCGGDGGRQVRAVLAGGGPDPRRGVRVSPVGPSERFGRPKLHSSSVPSCRLQNKNGRISSIPRPALPQVHRRWVRGERRDAAGGAAGAAQRLLLVGRRSARLFGSVAPQPAARCIDLSCTLTLSSGASSLADVPGLWLVDSHATMPDAS